MINHVRQYPSSKAVSLFVLCAATTVLGIAAAAPPRTVPIKGTFGTTATLSPTAIVGIFDDSIEGVGTVSGLGFCTIFVEQHVDGEHAKANTSPEVEN
jgi:hypothetical protein